MSLYLSRSVYLFGSVSDKTKPVCQRLPSVIHRDLKIDNTNPTGSVKIWGSWCVYSQEQEFCQVGDWNSRDV